MRLNEEERITFNLLFIIFLLLLLLLLLILILLSFLLDALLLAQQLFHLGADPDRFTEASWG